MEHHDNRRRERAATIELAAYAGAEVFKRIEQLRREHANDPCYLRALDDVCRQSAVVKLGIGVTV